MRIKICSRAEIEEMSVEPFENGTAVISITDTQAELVRLYNKPEYLLRLNFDDVTIEDFLDTTPTDEDRAIFNSTFHLFDDAQANCIAEFVYSINNKANMLICQCEYGQSRSAAVAAAISEHFNNNGIEIFADDRYCPNKTVYKKVLNALKIKNN